MARTIPYRLKGIPFLHQGYGRIGAGRQMWVSSSAADRSDDIGNYGASPDKPFATVDYAIGQCVPNRGDVIWVMENHAETLAAADAWNADIAGIKIIGLGVGDDRPTITFATATAADVEIAAANVEIANIVFLCNISSQTRMITLTGTADGAYIHHCEFREGTQTGLSMIEWTGVADDVRIEDNYFYAPTAGNYDEAILIASTPTRAHILRNTIIGDWDEGGINNAVGNIATIVDIGDNVVINLFATGVAAINLDSAVTGTIYRNLLGGETATILDPGSCYCFGNGYVAAGDFSDSPALPAVDSDYNFIGVDDANNVAATTLVAANRDGSILERLEHILDALFDDETTNYIGIDNANNAAATTSVVQNRDGSLLERLEHLAAISTGGDIASTANPLLGLKVNKTAATLPATTTQNIFTVAGGRCLITSLTGEVTTVVQAQACNLSVNLVTTVGGDIVLASTADINADEAGTLYVVEGDGTALVPQSSGAVLWSSGSGPMIVAEGTINIQTSATNTGATAWECWYFPLDAGATVVSA